MYTNACNDHSHYFVFRRFPAYNVHMYLLHLLSDLMLNDEVSSVPTSTDQRWAALH